MKCNRQCYFEIKSDHYTSTNAQSREHKNDYENRRRCIRRSVQVFQKWLRPHIEGK